MNFKFLGQGLAKTLKSVERSIDKAIGIPGIQDNSPANEPPTPTPPASPAQAAVKPPATTEADSGLRSKEDEAQRTPQTPPVDTKQPQTQLLPSVEASPSPPTDVSAVDAPLQQPQPSYTSTASGNAQTVEDTEQKLPASSIKSTDDPSGVASTAKSQPEPPQEPPSQLATSAPEIKSVENDAPSNSPTDHTQLVSDASSSEGEGGSETKHSKKRSQSYSRTVSQLRAEIPPSNSTSGYSSAEDSPSSSTTHASTPPARSSSSTTVSSAASPSTNPSSKGFSLFRGISPRPPASPELASSAPPEGSIESLKEEFSKRLGELERKLALVTKERDTLKRAYESATATATSFTTTAAATTATSNAEAAEWRRKYEESLKETAELRMEGEKMSKRIGTLEATIKKLRQQKKEDEQLIEQLNARISSTEQLLDSKTERLRTLEAEHRTLSDSLNSLKELSEVASRKLEEKTKTTDALTAKLAEQQTELERTMRELADARRALAATDDKSLALVRDAENSLKREFTELLRTQMREAAEREASLAQTITELRSAVARSNERAGWREEELQKEINDLKARLRDADMRHEEAAAVVAETTRPLLRQIEALQAAAAANAAAWDAVERSLNAQLAEERDRREAAVAAERRAAERLAEISAKFSALETSLAAERSGRSRLAAELEIERGRRDESERAARDAEARLEAARRAAEDYAVDSRRREDEWRRRYEEERAKVERLLALRTPPQPAEGVSTASIHAPMARSGSTSEVAKYGNGMETNAGIPPPRTPSPPPTAATAIAIGCYPLRTSTSQTDIAAHAIGGGAIPLSAAALEKLSDQLRQREGEVTALHAQMGTLEKAKRALEDELVAMTEKNEELAAKAARIPVLEKQLEELQTKYATALELMGEKSEQVEELRADLADVKEMYTNCIHGLLEKIDRLEKGERA